MEKSVIDDVIDSQWRFWKEAPSFRLAPTDQTYIGAAKTMTSLRANDDSGKRSLLCCSLK